MTAVNLLVANSTVPEARRPQIVERWRHDADHRLRAGRLGRQIGMALQTHVSHFLARQHSRVSGTMHFVTAGTAFQPHGRVLEGEWTFLVGVALETTGLVGSERPHLPEKKTAMRIVAVCARHCALNQPVSVRALKLAP